MADVAGKPAVSGATQTRAGGADTVAASADLSAPAPAFKATDYAALLAALGDTGRFETRTVASPLRRPRREGAGEPPSSADILRDRLRGGDFPADSASADALRSASAPAGKATARRPGPIATMVIAYLALVAASGGVIFYVWGGERTNVTSIATSIRRFRASLADAVATRLPAENGGARTDAAPPWPSASVTIRDIPEVPSATSAVASSAPVALPRGPEASEAEPSNAAAAPVPAAAVSRPIVVSEPPPAPPMAALASPPAPAAAASTPVEPPPSPVAAQEPAPAWPTPATIAAAPVPPPPPFPAPVSAAPASPPVSPAEIARLLHRGDELVATGDIAAARLFYQRAAEEGGSSRAATALGKTYDPAFLKQIGVRGGGADAAKAAEWYRRAGENGDAEAVARLKALRVGIAR